MYYDDDVGINRWREKRITIIAEHYGPEYFRGKTVLEVGAALGHIGAHFANIWDAKVSCSDHYKPWVDIIHDRHPNIMAFVQDINTPWPECHYDVIVHMGVLYHQPPHFVEPRLIEACQRCDELILESSVSKYDSPYHIESHPRPPNRDLYESVATEYCVPSKSCIDRILTEANMTFTSICYAESRYIWFGTKSEKNSGVRPK